MARDEKRVAIRLNETRSSSYPRDQQLRFTYQISDQKRASVCDSFDPSPFVSVLGYALLFRMIRKRYPGPDF